MAYSHTLCGERFEFADLRVQFAKANEVKSGDMLAGIAAESEQQRVAAKLALADVTIGEILDHALIDLEEDDVAAVLTDMHDETQFLPLR